LLETGRFATIREIAKAEKINPSYVSRVLRLTLRLPDLVEALVQGLQSSTVTARRDEAFPGRMGPTEMNRSRSPRRTDLLGRCRRCYAARHADDECFEIQAVVLVYRSSQMSSKR
jgi:hypothetical protein